MRFTPPGKNRAKVHIISKIIADFLHILGCLCSIHEAKDIKNFLIQTKIFYGKNQEGKAMPERDRLMYALKPNSKKNYNHLETPMINS